MDIMSKGRKTFTQSYNPRCIVVGEKKSKNQVVYHCYSSVNDMSPSYRFSYYAAARNNLMCR